MKKLRHCHPMYKTVRPMLSVRCLFCLSVCLSVTLVYCCQTVGRIEMKLGMQVRLGPGHVVLDGDPAPPSPKGHSPQFSGHTCCGQMAAWIKMSLGMELGLGPCDFMLDRDPDPPSPKGGRQSPIFGPCLLWPNGWMHQDATCYACRPEPRGLCVRWRPSHPSLKRGRNSPSYRPMFIVAKRLNGSRCYLARR